MNAELIGKRKQTLLNICRYGAGRFCLAVIFLLLSAVFFIQLLHTQRTILEIYRSGTDGDGKIFCKRLIKQISFKDYRTRVNLIVDGYSRGGFPPPEDFPPHTIEWSALLNIPVSGEYLFDVQSAGTVILRIGDFPVLDKAGKGSVLLSRGYHDFSLRYTNEGGSYEGIPQGMLKLMWKSPDTPEWREITSKAFSRSEPSAWFNRSGILSFLCTAFFLAFLALILMERKFLRVYWGVLAIILIVFLGGALRFHQYNIIPLYNETMDELDIGWMGWSLLKLGIPVGWDWLPGYGDWSSASRFWFGNIFQILSPTFSYPPLFYILIGMVTIFSGAEELLQVTVSNIRILPVVFSTTTILLIYIFLKDKFGRCTALLSSLLFAVIPAIVVSGRLAKGENMVSLLLLLSLILYVRSLSSVRWQAAFPVGAVIGLACLAKFTALSFLVGMCFVYLSQKRWKQAAAVLFAGAAFASLYFAYGAFIDWGMFVRVFSSQRARLSFLDVPVKMIFQPKITDTIFLDGGVLFLWVSILCMGFFKNEGMSRDCLHETGFERDREGIPHPNTEIAKDIGILFAVYFLLISVYVSSRHVFGWYLIPLYPLLCAGGGIVIGELLRKKSVLLMAVFVGLAVMMNLQYCLPENIIRSLMFPKFLVTALIFPILPYQIWKTRFCNYLAICGIVFVVLIYVVTSIVMVLRFPEIY